MTDEKKTETTAEAEAVEVTTADIESGSVPESMLEEHADGKGEENE